MRTVALIGCSRISKKHIEAFAAHASRLTLSAVCDPKLDRAQVNVVDYTAKCPGANVRVHADYRAMLREMRPDIVSIATESGLHAQIAVDCLKAGVHVVCEKPMALSTRDANAMVEAARQSGRKLAISFQNRFSPAIVRTRAALEAGRFGRVLHGMVQMRWNRGDSYYAEAPWRGTWKLDGGTLMNQCTHAIDLLQWMMGEDAVRVQAATRRFLRPIEAEDFGAAIVEFASGAVGIVEGSVDVFPSNLAETLSIFGERGTVVIGGMAIDKIETWRFSDAESVGDAEEIVLREQAENKGARGGHVALFADFLDALDAGRDPLVSGVGGERAIDIVLAIYKAQKTGRPVDIPCEFSTDEMSGVDFSMKGRT